MNAPIRIELSKPQFAFTKATDRFPCFCGGFGSGKTFAGIVRALKLKCRYPSLNVGYYLPTYDLVKQVGYPGFSEVMEAMGIAGQINRGDREIMIPWAGKIIFRSMDSPERIVGYKHADAVVDELDTLKPVDAKRVWNKIIARNRQVKPDGQRGTVAVATTPEGFKFVYENWKKAPKEGYTLHRASTYTNAKYLPEDYIPSLLATYPTNVAGAYLDGEFVNMTSGSVYQEFDRGKNDTQVLIEPGETLHVGMDFNVMKMAAIIHVQREGEPHAVDELVNVFDTPAMIKSLSERYPRHPIMVYPDASGQSRKSVNASESDLALLRGASFTVCVNPSNPKVKDRVLSVSAMIHKDGKRTYRVSQDRCPHLVEAFEKQAYDSNGEPDKSTGHDHPIDAAGYYIVYRWPIRKPATTINLGFAH